MIPEADEGVHCLCHTKRFFLAYTLLLSCGVTTVFFILSYFISAIYPKFELGSELPGPHSCVVVEGHGVLIALSTKGQDPPVLRPPGFLPSPLTDGNSLFDSMASGMRLIVSCISSFLILSLLLFMVHRLRQRRRERIESLIGANCECPRPCL